jgi:ribonuclease HII
MTIGIDEVGRGCWAGPLLIVAARQTKELPAGLKDSKQLSKLRRESFIEAIKDSCDIGEGWIMPAEIDRLGLTTAMQLGVERALDAISATAKETIIMDGNINFCDKKYVKASAIVAADDLFPIVSAASIYAKVTRDNYMADLPQRYQKYEFKSHVGYGTALHAKLLQEFGVSDMHRHSFAPIRKLL